MCKTVFWMFLRVKCSSSTSVSSAVPLQPIQCPRVLCARRPETWRGRGRSESLPRTPCHIWCRRRRAVSSAGGQGARCGAVRAPPRERSGCRGPALRGGPTDTEHTWGFQGSHRGSECHFSVVVCGQCCPGPAEILQRKYRHLMNLFLKCQNEVRLAIPSSTLH